MIGIVLVLFVKSEKEGYRNDSGRICRFDVWNGRYERSCKAVG